MRSLWTKRTALFFTLFVTMLLFVSCGGGGGGSSAPPVIPPNIGGGQGSTASPVYLGTVGPPATYAGSIGTVGSSYYKFTTDSNGGMFKISLTNTHSTLDWSLYTDPNFSSWMMDCPSGLPSTGDITCITLTNLNPNTSYDLLVQEWDLTSDTYTLTISEIVSEGTSTSPVLLTVGTSHSGSVNASGNSFYKFQTNSAGEYSIDITNSQSNGTENLGIQVSSTDFTSPTIMKTCTPGYNPTCTVNGLAANTYYYVEVSQGAAYDVIYNIAVNPGSSEGSVSNPVQLTYGANHAGAVDAYGYSYYTFTPTNTGDSIITLTSSSTVNATVYSNPDFATGPMKSCNVTTGQPCTVSGVNSGQPYYLLVNNSTGPSSISYTLKAQSGSTEGSISQPVSLTTGTTPHSASIDANGVAYYYFNTGADGPTSGSGTYTFSLTTSLAAGYALFSDPNFSVPVFSTISLNSNTNYYLEVLNNSSTSGTFSITVSTGFGNSEGSISTPVALTEGTPHSGRIAPQGYSYYTFTPSKNTAYLIRLTNVLSGGGSAGVMWYLYTGSNFSSGYYGSGSSPTFAGDIVSSTSSSLTAGTPYYLEVYNWVASANTYTVTITPFDVSLGCNSGGTSTCFNFDAGIPTSNTFVNGPTDIFTSTTPWALVTSSIGGGTQSFQSTAPNGKQGVAYDSCFKFTATDVKWIGVSSRISSAPTAGTDYLNVYVDGVFMNNSTIDFGNTAWNRSIFIPSSGTHTYEWCYCKSSNATGDYAEVDDIELNY